MVKRKGQTMIYKTQHRKLKIEQHEISQKNSGELMYMFFLIWFYIPPAKSKIVIRS